MDALVSNLNQGDVPLITGGNDVLQTNAAGTAAVWNDFLVLGDAPATSGTIRLVDGFTIQARNPGNTSNVPILSEAAGILTLGGNDADITNIALSVGAGGTIAFLVAGATEATMSATQLDLSSNDLVLTGVIKQGATVASTGDYRVRNTWTLVARNAGDTSDAPLLGYSTPTITLGGDDADVTQILFRLGAAAFAYIFRVGAANDLLQLDTAQLLLSVPINFTSGMATPVIQQLTDATATVTGDLFTIHAQDVSGATAVTGGKMLIRPGNATGGAGTRNGGDMAILVGTGATLTGNMTLITNNTAWNSMQGGIFIGNATAVPVGNPTAGGYMFATGGAGTWRGSGGTVTTFGPAEPHCPRCGTDYCFEARNDDKGHHLAICWTCFVREAERKGLDRSQFVFIDRIDAAA